MTKKIPDKWNKKDQVVKAMQVAFEMERDIARAIRERAARNGLTPSDQMRKILGLSYSPPKRPRLTISLSVEDYAALGKKYGIVPENTLEIKRKIMDQLADDNKN